MTTMMKTTLTASVLSLLLLVGATSAQALTSISKEIDIEAVALKVANETVQGGYKLLTMDEVKQMLDSGEDFVLVDAHPRWEFEMGNYQHPCQTSA